MIDPRNGYSTATKTFHSVRPVVTLPPENAPISAATYALSLQLSTPWPHLSAIIDSETGQRVSYSEFIQLTENLASCLTTQLKLTKGQTAFILSPNSKSIPILYFSLLSIGVIISPANPFSADSDISRQIQLCQPVEVSQSDTAAVMYSSGTTGPVKGAVLTHRNLIAITSSYQVDNVRDIPSVVMYSVPFFHVIGLFYCLKSVSLSETVVVMKRFDLEKMCRGVQEYKVTQIVGAPPVVLAMTKNSITDKFDLKFVGGSGIRWCSFGKRYDCCFQCEISRHRTVSSKGYGMTETSGAIFRSTSPEESLRWGSVGKLTGHCEGKIVDLETGNALPPGKQGELWIRGPLVMKGYIDDLQATSETLVTDGWLRTNDLCYIDDEGFLFVVDRLKELIKYKGYMVPPAELEQLLQSHPEIVDAAVIPYPDEEAGEVPMACVVKRSSTIDETQVMDFIAKQVAPYKKIRRVWFVSSIPKTASGKILRKDLRKAAALGFVFNLW